MFLNFAQNEIVSLSNQLKLKNFGLLTINILSKLVQFVIFECRKRTEFFWVTNIQGRVAWLCKWISIHKYYCTGLFMWIWLLWKLKKLRASRVQTLGPGNKHRYRWQVIARLGGYKNINCLLLSRVVNLHQSWTVRNTTSKLLMTSHRGQPNCQMSSN